MSETYNIKKHPHMKKYEGEIAYWCPTSIKNTEEAISLVESVLNFNFEKLIDRFDDSKEVENEEIVGEDQK